MATPDDKKIDFEKLKLSEDISGSLEPLAEEAPELPMLEQEAEAEAQTDEEAKSDKPESDAGAEAAVPTTSKYRDLLEKLSTADPFTVMLGIAVAAMLIAILCCLIELGRYGFDVGAKKAKSTVTMTAPVDIPHSFC